MRHPAITIKKKQSTTHEWNMVAAHQGRKRPVPPGPASNLVDLCKSFNGKCKLVTVLMPYVSEQVNDRLKMLATIGITAIHVARDLQLKRTLVISLSL